MKIHVEFVGFFNPRKYKLEPVVEMPEGSTMYDLYLNLGIEDDDQGHVQAFINDDASWKSTKLKDNDRVVIVWILTGG